jgi:hypothetical protein
MPGTEISHTDLSSSVIEERRRIAVWLEAAHFAPIEVTYKERKIKGVFRCEDPERNAKLRLLVVAMVKQRLGML